MKKVWIISAIFVLIILIGGSFFIFGSDVLDSFGKTNFIDKDSVQNGDGGTNGDGQVTESGIAILNKSGEGSGESGGGGGTPDSVFICNRYQPLQYSLGSFIKDVECLVNGTTECEKIRVECSTELYNLDYDASGVFKIKYSLTSEGEILGYDFDDGNVGARNTDVLNVEFVEEGSFDVDKMGCLIDMDSVPQKCVDGYWN